MAGQIRVVTLAAPFLRVFARRSFQLPLLVKSFVSIGMGIILVGLQWIVLSATGLADILQRFTRSGPFDIGDLALPLLLTTTLGMVAGGFIANWLLAIHTNTQAALAIEEEATYDTKGAAASRMLVIRGVDDEASLALVAGLIGSRLGYLVLVAVIPAIFVLAYVPFLVVMFYPDAASPLLYFVLFGTWICAPIFLVLPGVIKSFFFGREFMVNAFVCDIAVDSSARYIGPGGGNHPHTRRIGVVKTGMGKLYVWS